MHTAYQDLYDKQDRITELYNEYAESLSDKLLERAGRMQEEPDAAGFYDVDTKIERVISGLGLKPLGALGH